MEMRVGRAAASWVWLVLGLGASNAAVAVEPDALSDQVGAVAAEFRVDESGAATYSIPIYAVPGTAGVTPSIRLNYSSQGGDGPLGPGWSIGGLSSITRCRATRESGDFVANGQPVDGDPGPIDFSTADQFCLDGERLLPVANHGGSACPAVPGASLHVQQYRTELESFQRICAYKNAATDASPRFFSVERKDGSVSFYGDRDGWVAQATREDGYVETNAPGKEGEAITWAQTRFEDSTGNYIDYRYREANFDGELDLAEHLPDSIHYTGKRRLPNQTGVESPTYAEIRFHWDQHPNGVVWKYSSGATHTLGQFLMRIESWNEGKLVRSYRIDAGPSDSNSGRYRINAIQECADAQGARCKPPTRFAWSEGKYEFATNDSLAMWVPDFDKLRSYRIGDVDGDGRPDIVWVKDTSDTCSTGRFFVAFSDFDSQGRLTFSQPPQAGYCAARKMEDVEDSWHLLDYNGDGRDDLMVAGAAGTRWFVFPAKAGRPSATMQTAFDTAVNLIAGIDIPVPAEEKRLAQLTDLNGDGLLDVVYPVDTQGATVLKARLTERVAAGFAWGRERTLVAVSAPGGGSAVDPCDDALPETVCYTANFSRRLGSLHLNDFNGDGRADPLFTVTVTQPDPACPPRSQQDAMVLLAQQRLREALGLRTTDRDVADASQAERPLLMASAEADQAQQALLSATRCSAVRSSYVAAYTVDRITEDEIKLRLYGSWLESASDHSFPTLRYFRTGDINGDGLTDVLRKYAGSDDWMVQLNSGAGYLSPETVQGPIPNEDRVQLLDVTGDGRADMVYPSNESGKPFKMRPAIGAPEGALQAERGVPGGNARGCESGDCELGRYLHLLADFDGDGVTDFVRLQVAGRGSFYTSRAARRFLPRDVIVRITNGLGAVTELDYLPLTNNAVYRRDTGSRDRLMWGRGAPVQDFLAPLYVVARARSSAPVWGDPDARSSVYYRYAGAKMQGGGRGFLGFREITTVDENMLVTTGKKILTTTHYRQDFPFVGRPERTEVWAVPGSFTLGSCTDRPEQNACFTPSVPFSGVDGIKLQDNVQFYSSAPRFDPAVQAPLFLRMDGSEETRYELNGGAPISRVISTFQYDAYGNAVSTEVLTYNGADTVALHAVRTDNAYTNLADTWRLGRLTSSTVTHRRGDARKVRTTRFAYDMSGAKTGLLTAEAVQPGGGEELELRTLYRLDAFGNRTHSFTCSAQLSDTQCMSNTIDFHPNDPTRIHRYTRTEYDAHGRYVRRRYEPFWNGSAAVEKLAEEVLERNALGDVTWSRDANGVDRLAVFGSFGQPYYTWVETQAGAVVGQADKGLESWTTYRFCGSQTGQVSCPADARFRREVRTEGAPTRWTYFDVLGRAVLEVTQAFQSSADASFSAVCSYFDAAGRSERTSE
ncbi:MAG: hypothetical protein KatS3mg126_0013 [Lysobacteraceae bacterium]|nr:MAG: hypothetical protein KatS3mg126_0013 [Xanthomonadaceae bacterium]